MNKVILIGRLARDPELKTTQSGKFVATFTLAVNRRFKQEGQPQADFFNIVAWGKQAETICNYLDKGKQMGLSGRLQSRSYDAQDGTKRYVTEVVLEEFDFIGSKNDGQQGGGVKQPQTADFDDDFHLMAEDDEVPF